MTLTINLPDLLAEPLKAESLARGVSPDQYSADIVERALSVTSNRSEEPSNVQAAAPFWQRITDRMKGLPSAVFDKLSKDGAAEHDHYLYGAPKNRS